MRYDELLDFLERRMTMSHVYQPLLIRTLVMSGGMATVRQLALALLNEDERQIRYYEDRIKKMPVPVLERHGVVERTGELVRLKVDPLSYEQQARLKAVCERRIAEFLEKRGIAVWDYRVLEGAGAPERLHYQGNKASEHRGALRRVAEDRRSIDVDYILARSRGGKNLPESLPRAGAKGSRLTWDQDDTALRTDTTPEREPGCAFCDDGVVRTKIAEHGQVFAVPATAPVAQGHTLILPYRHAADYFAMTVDERRDADDLLRMLRNRALQLDPTIRGFSVRMDCGPAAGQTVPHAHIHLIPRRPNDALASRDASTAADALA